MAIQTMRLGVGILFLLLAAVILGRAWLLPDLGNRFDPVRMSLGGVLALVFGLLNVARWYVAWSHRRGQATPVRRPLQPDPSANRDEPPNPELDFTKPEG